jgi:hypothetical protein
VRQCPWIFQAPAMSAAIGTKNNIGTRVERREKLSNSLPPYRQERKNYDLVRRSQSRVGCYALAVSIIN